MKTAPTTVTLRNQVRTWTLDKNGHNKREYITVELDFREARQIFKTDKFDAKKGSGEQREGVKSHVNKLRREMEENRWTPTAVEVGLRPRHRRSVEFITGEDGTRLAVLEVSSQDPLPQTDGGHRFGSMEAIYQDALQSEDGDLADLVLGLPVTALVLLDGDTQKDFINLQQGRAIDSAHMLSLRVQTNTVGEKEIDPLRLALEVGRHLNTHRQSPFLKQIRFDSRGMSPIAITSLAAKSSSDLGTSLVGLARVGLAGRRKTTADKLALCVVETFRSLEAGEPELLREQMVLTPPPDGTKGSATMIVGLSVCLAYRLQATNTVLPHPEHMAKLVAAAKATMNHGADYRGFSAQAKRSLLGEFAAEFFADLDCEKHRGIPVGLIQVLSCSAFGVSPIPKAPKPPKVNAVRAAKTSRTASAAEQLKLESEAEIVEAKQTTLAEEITTENE